MGECRQLPVKLEQVELKTLLEKVKTTNRLYLDFKSLTRIPPGVFDITGSLESLRIIGSDNHLDTIRRLCSWSEIFLGVNQLSVLFKRLKPAFRAFATVGRYVITASISSSLERRHLLRHSTNAAASGSCCTVSLSHLVAFSAWHNAAAVTDPSSGATALAPARCKAVRRQPPFSSSLANVVGAAADFFIRLCVCRLSWRGEMEEGRAGIRNEEIKSFPPYFFSCAARVLCRRACERNMKRVLAKNAKGERKRIDIR